MFYYQEIDLKRIKGLRNLYLDSMHEPQELFIELMVPNAHKYLIQFENRDVGYFIKTREDRLIEFYISDSFVPKCKEIFKDILARYGIRNCYCKSFDALLLKVCLHNAQAINIIGVLYRHFFDKEVPIPGAIDEIRIAGNPDFEDLVQIKDEVFDTDEELIDTINRQATIVFRNKGILIGYGIFQPAFAGRASYDIGMAVSPQFRRKGYGAYILNYMKNHCLQNNWKPTCGCAIENIASQKTIEKIGFVSKYNMLEFKF